MSLIQTIRNLASSNPPTGFDPLVTWSEVSRPKFDLKKVATLSIIAFNLLVLVGFTIMIAQDILFSGSSACVAGAACALPLLFYIVILVPATAVVAALLVAYCRGWRWAPLIAATMLALPIIPALWSLGLISKGNNLPSYNGRELVDYQSLFIILIYAPQVLVLTVVMLLDKLGRGIVPLLFAGIVALACFQAVSGGKSATTNIDTIEVPKVTSGAALSASNGYARTVTVDVDSISDNVISVDQIDKNGQSSTIFGLPDMDLCQEFEYILSVNETAPEGRITWVARSDIKHMHTLYIDKAGCVRFATPEGQTNEAIEAYVNMP